MQRVMWGLFVACLAFSLDVAQAQPASVPAGQSRKIRPAEAQLISERGADWQTVRNLVPYQDGQGNWQYQTNTYVQLETGLNRPDEHGVLVPSDPSFVPAPDGAHAWNGKHKATLAGSPHGAGAVQVRMPDNRLLVGNVVGLAYYDVKSGAATMIADVQEAQGWLTKSNQVVYVDAFDGVKADIRYTSRRRGLEQDVILRETPPDPVKLGFDPATTRLEVWTEFTDAPDATLTKREQPDLAQRGNAPGPLIAEDAEDSLIDLGSMRIGEGRAFAIGAQSPKDKVSVRKQWLRTKEGRVFLIEAVDISSVQTSLNSLPRGGAGLSRPWHPGVSRMEALLKLPKKSRSEKTQAAVRSPTLEEALELGSRAGFVMDYELLSYTSTLTLRGDTTYRVTEQMFVSGTTTLEGGAVVKFDKNGYDPINETDTNPMLGVGRPFVCLTSQYRPAVFTAVDDDTVGEKIPGSTGNPGTAYYAGDYSLYCWNAGGGPSMRVENVVFKNLSYGVTFYSGISNSIVNAQFINCYVPISGGWTGAVGAYNVLIQDAAGAAYAGDRPGAHLYGEHVTIRNASVLLASNYALNVTLKNSLLTGVANTTGYVNGGGTVVLASDTGVFQSVLGGKNYLANGSPYRNVGVTTIHPQLATILRGLTTYPPALLTTGFTTSTTLSPQAKRDTDTPDLGYHYTPLDYAWSNLTLNSGKTLTLTNGVAVGLYGTVGLNANGTFISTGKADALNRLTLLNTVQEQLQGIITDTSSFSLRTASSANVPATFRFTDFSFLASSASGREISFYSNPIGDVTMTDCQLRGVNWANLGDAYLHTLTLKNCLCERTSLTFGQGTSSANNRNLAITLQNVLFSRCSLSLMHAGSSYGAWNIYDNLFDNCASAYGGGLSLTEIGSYPTGSALTTLGYNGFIGTTAIGSTGNKTGLSRNFQTGPLGGYYYPNSGASPSLATLVDADTTRTPAALGLYHHTTRADLAKDSVTPSNLDIGFHYVATDASGNPLDTDGDGIPDYLEDANGNGAVNAGETDAGRADTDGDGMDDGLEIANGRNPLNGNDAPNQLMSQWRFNRPNFVSEQGDEPVSGYHAQFNPKSWDGNAAQIDVIPTGVPYAKGWLGYAWKDAQGRKLLNPVRGTVQFWFRPNWDSLSTVAPLNAGPTDGISTQRKLIAVQAANDVGEYWALELNPGGNTLSLNIKRQDDATARTIVMAGVNLKRNEWVHLAVTYDSTGAALWKNGAQIATSATVPPNWPVAALGAAAKILWVGGWSSTGSPSTANAEFENVSIYNYRQPLNEIQSGYQQVASLDSDGDGLSDLLELSQSDFSPAWATGAFRPDQRDSDNDGLPDAWEYKYFGDNHYGANNDPDADQRDNLTEYVDGTNPNVADTNLGPAGTLPYQLVDETSVLINIDFVSTAGRLVAPDSGSDVAGLTSFPPATTSINPVLAVDPATDSWNTVGAGFATIRLAKWNGAPDVAKYLLQNTYGPLTQRVPDGCEYALDAQTGKPIRPKYSKPPGYVAAQSADAPGGSPAGGAAPLPPNCTVMTIPVEPAPAPPWSPADPGRRRGTWSYIIITNCAPVYSTPADPVVGGIGPISLPPYVPPVEPPPTLVSDPCGTVTYRTDSWYPPGFRFPYTFSVQDIASHPQSVVNHPMFSDFLITDEETINQQYQQDGWYPYAGITKLAFNQMDEGYWRVVVYGGTGNPDRAATIQIGDDRETIQPGNPFEDHFIEGRHYVQGLVHVTDNGVLPVIFPKPAAVNGIQLLLLKPLAAAIWETDLHNPQGALIPPVEASVTAGMILRWRTVPGALTYAIRRAETADGPWTQIAERVKATRFRDATVTLGPGNAAKTYWYKIIAQNEVDDYSSESEVKSQVLTVLNLANRPPVLNYINPLGPAWAGKKFAVALEELHRRAQAADFEGTPLTFRIERLLTGKLIVDGSEVTDAQIQSQLSNAADSERYSIRPGTSVIWQPAANENGVVNAFEVRAFDGMDHSYQTATVPVTVKPPVEVLWSGGFAYNLAGNGKLTDPERQSVIHPSYFRYDWILYGLPNWWEVVPSPVLSSATEHLPDVVQLAAGYHFTLALKSDGTLWSWGNGGACMGDTAIHWFPGKDLPWFTDKPRIYAAQIAFAQDSLPPVTPLPPLPSIRQVSAGSDYCVAVSTDGHVYTWGIQAFLAKNPLYNLCDDLLAVPTVLASFWEYDPDYPQSVDQATQGAVYGTPTPTLLKGLDRVVMAACANNGTVVLREDGTIWDWGTVGWDDPTPVCNAGDCHRLGYTAIANMASSRPIRRDALDGQTAERIIEVAAGDDSFLALAETGQVYAWGAYDSMAFANPLLVTAGTSVPTKVLGLPANIVHITAREKSYLAVTAEGKLYQWGYSGKTVVARATVVDGLPPIDRAFTTGIRSFAADRDGRLWGWGANCYEGTGYAGVLVANDKSEYITQPVLLADLASVQAVSSPDRHTMHYSSEQLPSSPRNLTARGGDATVTLTWASYPSATSYRVYQSDSSTGNYVAKVQLAAGAGSKQAWVDTGVRNGGKYYYQVTAIVAGVETGPSRYAYAMPLGKPDVVTGLNGVGLSRELRIRWCPSPQADRYLIWRAGPNASSGTVPDSDYKLYYALDAHQLPTEDTVNQGCKQLYITDADLVAGAYYRYRITAENATGTSPAAEAVAGVPLSPSGITSIAPTLGSISVHNGSADISFTDNSTAPLSSRVHPGWVVRLYQYRPAKSGSLCSEAPDPADGPDPTDSKWALVRYLMLDDINGGKGSDWSLSFAAGSSSRMLFLDNLANGPWYKVVLSSRDIHGENPGGPGGDAVGVFHPTALDGKITVSEMRSGPGYIYVKYKSDADFFITKLLHDTPDGCLGTLPATQGCLSFTEWPWTDGSETETWLLNLPAPAPTYAHDYQLRIEPGGSVDSATSFEHTFTVTARSNDHPLSFDTVKSGDRQLTVQWDDAGNYAGWRFMVERISVVHGGTPPQDCDLSLQWTFLKTGPEHRLVDKGLDNGLDYKYRVIAVNPEDTSEAGLVWDVTGWVQPGATANWNSANPLTATPRISAVELSWREDSLVNLRSGVNVVRYELHHREGSSGADEILYSVDHVPPPLASTVYSFLHQPLLNGSFHTYWLETVFDNEDQLTAPPLTVSPSATLSPANPPNLHVREILVAGSNPATYRIYLDWDPAPGARAYTVYWQVPGTTTCSSQMTARTAFDYPTAVAGGAEPKFFVTATGSGGTESSASPCTSVNLRLPTLTSAPISLNGLNTGGRKGSEAQNVVLMLPGCTGGTTAQTPAAVVTPTNVTLQASIAISGATLQKVQYYSDNSLVGEVSGTQGQPPLPPYSFDWINPPASPATPHQIVAVAVTKELPPQASALAYLKVTVRPPLSEFTTSETDFELKGVSAGFPLTREYRSSDGASGILGVGWKFNFEKAQIQRPSSASGSDLSGGWELAAAPKNSGLLSFLHPVVQETAAAKHEIKVVLPNGATLQFAPVVTLDNFSGSADDLSTLLELGLDDQMVTAKVSYYPIDGSGAQLKVMDPNMSGDVNLTILSSSGSTDDNGTGHLPVQLTCNDGSVYNPTQFRLILADQSQFEYALTQTPNNRMRLTRIVDTDGNGFEFQTWGTGGTAPQAPPQTSFRTFTDPEVARIKVVAMTAMLGGNPQIARELWLDLSVSGDIKTWTLYDPVVTAEAAGTGTPNVTTRPGIRKLVSVYSPVWQNSYLGEVQQLVDRTAPTPSYRVQRYQYATFPNPAVNGFSPQTVLEQVINPDGVRQLRNAYGVNDGLLVLTDQWDATGIHRTMAYPGSTGGDLTSSVATPQNVPIFGETVQYSERGEITKVTGATGLATQNAYDDRGRLAFSGTLSGGNGALANTTAYAYDDKDRPTDVTDANGATAHYEYRADSRPREITDPNLNRSQFIYDDDGGAGKLRTAIQGDSNYTDYAYNSRGQVTMEARYLADTGKAVTTIYEYYEANSASGRIGDLKRVYQPLAEICKNISASSALPDFPATLPLHATEYTYDSNGNRLTETSLRNTRVVVSGAEVTKLERITTTYTVDPLGRSVAAARARDWVTVSGSAYVPESGSALTLETSSTVFDNAGRQASSTDPYSRKTSSLYDVRGNLIQTAYPDGTVTRTVYDALGRPIVTQERATPSVAASGNVPPLGTTTAPTSQTDYDAAGRVIFTHRQTGTVITVVADTSYQGYVDGNPAQYKTTVTTPGTDWSRTRTVYNSAGQVQYQVNPLGTLTENVYDTAGRRTEVRSYYNSTFPLDTTAISTTGKPYYRTTYGYDPAGNNIWVRDANANAAGSTVPATLTEFTYDSLNRRTVTTFPAVPTVTGTRVTRSTVYDSLGQRVQEVDEDGVTTAFSYDSGGRLTAVMNDWKAGKVDTAQTFRTTYEYDEVGNQIAQVDAEGRRTRYEYDALGRRVARVLPGGSLATANTVEKTVYTMVGSNPSLLRRDVTDFAGRTRTYNFDISDRQQSLLLPATPATTSRLLTWEYSVAGRLGRVREYDGGTSGGTILRSQQYVYDDAGRLAIKVVPEGTLTMTYDAAGNQTGLTARKTYTLNATGAGVTLSQVTVATSADPAGADQVYDYDKLGRFATVKTDAESVADATYGYDPNGNLQTLTYQNGVTTTYSYNARNQLRLAKALKGTTLVGEFDYDGAETSPPWSPAVFTVDRTLSATGMRRQMAEQIGTAAYGVYQYDYDSLHRLVREHRGAATTDNPLIRYDAWTDHPVPNPDVVHVGYDKVGNRRNRSVQIGTARPSAWQQFDYDANDRINGSRSLGHTSTSATAFTYDANGNTLTADLDASGTADNVADIYDAQNRLIQAVRGTKTITLTYDPDGNRVSKAVTISGVTTTTKYLVADTNPTGHAQVLEEWTGSPLALAVRYTYGLGLVGQRRAAAADTRYFGRDGLGSVRYLTDRNGGLTDAYCYDAFGLQQQQLVRKADGTQNPPDGTLIAPNGANQAALNVYRYAGEQWDADLGLYYNRARYYSPELGRFWSMDTFEGSQSEPVSLHKYLYCQDNAANATDPLGHETMVSIGFTMSIMGQVDAMYLGGSAKGLSAARRISGSTDFDGLINGLEYANIVQDKVSLALAAAGLTYATANIAKFLSTGAYRFLATTTVHTLQEFNIVASKAASYYSYAELKAAIKAAGLSGSSEGLEAHHLLHKVFAKRMGLNPDEIIAVPLTPLSHRNVGGPSIDIGAGANIFQRLKDNLAELGTTIEAATPELIWKAHKNVYQDINHPEWAEAIYEAYFQGKGIAF